MDPSSLLRRGLLEGTVAAVSGACSEAGQAIARGFAPLGATVLLYDADPGVAALAGHIGGSAHALDVDPLDEEALAAAAAEAVAGHGPPDVVICAAAPGAEDGFRSVVEGAWLMTRAFAQAAMIPGPRGGKAITVAPAGTGADEEAIRAALENMARTLSIEWSRYGIRTVSIQRGPQTDPDAVAALAAYLASPAGDYFSGCALTLE